VKPRLVLLGVYGLFAYHFCLFLALRLAPPVEANLINYLWPLLIVLLSPVIVPAERSRCDKSAAPSSLRRCGGAHHGRSDRIPSSRANGVRTGPRSGRDLVDLLALDQAPCRRPTSAVATYCLVSGLLSLTCHLVLEPRYVPTAPDLPYLLWIGVARWGSPFTSGSSDEGRGFRVIGTLAYLTPLLSTVLIAAVGEGRLTTTSLVAMGMIVAARPSERSARGNEPDRREQLALEPRTTGGARARVSPHGARAIRHAVVRAGARGATHFESQTRCAVDADGFALGADPPPVAPEVALPPPALPEHDMVPVGVMPPHC